MADFLAACSAPDEGVSAREQFLDAEGFADIVVGADVQAADDVFLLALGGEHDDGHAESGLTDAAADLITIELREHDVQNDEIQVDAHGQMQCYLSIRGCMHLVSP